MEDKTSPPSSHSSADFSYIHVTHGRQDVSPPSPLHRSAGFSTDTWNIRKKKLHVL